MLEQLKEKVYIANQDLMDISPFPFSWISVSAIDRDRGLVIMMPDGGAVTEDDMAVVDLSGHVLEGKEPPVRDTAVHLALYRFFPEIGSVAHPYSRWATIFAQLEQNIPALGTVHEETFHADIPSTYPLPKEVLKNPGDIRIAQAIDDIYRICEIQPLEVPAVLVSGLGAYTFGEDAREAVSNAAVLDETAFLAYHTIQMDSDLRKYL